jgi:hypothetical protein
MESLLVNLTEIGIDPGKRADSSNWKQGRPVHGIHVHGRDWDSESDRLLICQRVPLVIPHLTGLAKIRYAELLNRAHC